MIFESFFKDQHQEKDRQAVLDLGIASLKFWSCKYIGLLVIIIIIFIFFGVFVFVFIIIISFGS